MDTIIALATSVAWFFAKSFGRAYLGLGGVSMMLFAVHLVIVQPKPEYNQVGWTDQKRALLMAVPLFIVGFVLVCVAWGDPQ